MRRRRRGGDDVPAGLLGITRLALVLAILAWGNLLLANAAHLGGELVHRYGVRATIAEPESEANEEDLAADDSTEEAEEGE